MTRLSNRLASAAQAALATLVLALAPSPSPGAATDLSDIPMAVSIPVTPNFLIVLDNSQSMDAFMGGTLQSGDNTNTRGNLGRPILRTILNKYRTTFNWGLMSFDTQDPELMQMHVFYMGNDVGMVFTRDCVAAESGGQRYSASNGGRRCVANPQWVEGESEDQKYVTYDLSSDDPTILDALYDTTTHGWIWGVVNPAPRSDGKTGYDLFLNHTSSSTWAASEFPRDSFWVGGPFPPTDAGFVPSSPTVTRMLFRPRGTGYRAPITGGGKLWEQVSSDSTEHYGKLISSLANETIDLSTPEIKNGALYTPIAGTLTSAKSYFSKARPSDGSPYSPITASCQKNFVMLLTDGLPTGDSNGALYSETARTDTPCVANATTCLGGYTFGAAATAAFNAVSALRSVPFTGCTNCSTFDILTYVIAMGDTVTNPRATALMNRMADLGGTGSAFFPTNENALQTAISAAVENAVSRTSATAAVAVANANITAGTASYQSSYDPDNWAGDLQSYPLDVGTGTDAGKPLMSSPRWSPSAQRQLDILAAASSRKIVSYSGIARAGQGIRFQPAAPNSTTTLSDAQQKTMLSAAGAGADAAGIVNFIRGDRSGEGTIYRRRAHVLGDIVNSEPVLVAGPASNYNETTDPSYAGYDAFKTDNAARQSMVYQGANDGMLHAFNATSGAEEWAYVPNLVLSTLAKLSRLNYSHTYYVDGTPTVGDVDLNRTAGATRTGSDWRTILVGGLGKGGYGYYALDITNPVAADEAAAATKVLWEFPNSSTPGQIVANLGYSFGKPIITKTDDKGWVVLVSSGYNNTRKVHPDGTDCTVLTTVDGAHCLEGDGVGHLFVLNARTGEVIRDITTTGVGTNAEPSGLAAFSGYADNADADNRVTQVYAGDLMGNVWRFDLTGTSSQWNVKKLATLVDASTPPQPQPVTTAPELALIVENHLTYRFVYVGTGRYLGNTDVSSIARQTMYGLVDNRSDDPLINPLRDSLQQQTLTPDPNPSGRITRTATTNTFVLRDDLLTGDQMKRGWYIDLPSAGERISTDPQLALGSLVFTSNIPHSASGMQCDAGGSSFLNIVDYRTGGALAYSTQNWSSIALGDALASRPVLVQLPTGILRALIRLSTGENVTEGVPSPGKSTTVRRVSWRELPDK